MNKDTTDKLKEQNSVVVFITDEIFNLRLEYANILAKRIKEDRYFPTKEERLYITDMYEQRKAEDKELENIMYKILQYKRDLNVLLD